MSEADLAALPCKSTCHVCPGVDKFHFHITYSASGSNTNKMCQWCKDEKKNHLQLVTSAAMKCYGLCCDKQY